MLILLCTTDICSCKFSAKVSLMLDNPFLVPSLCNLNHISLCFIQICTKSLANCLFPSAKAMIFWSHPRCFGPLGKFQHDIKISIKTACVSRLSVSCDYVFNQGFKLRSQSALKNWKFKKERFPGWQRSYSTKMKGKCVFLTKILVLNET